MLTVKTKLIEKERELIALSVAETLKFPVLLIGDIGTGKTQLFLDYASAKLNNPDETGKIFVKQLSFDTRAEEILGYISIPEFRNGKIMRINSIAEAEYILIDEVDKANSAVRNLFLSVLREKKIFDGEKVVPCMWKLFVGTSNRSEFDEEDKAFLDRFVLKVTVHKVGLPLADKLLEPQVQEIIIEPAFNPDALKIKEKIKSLLPELYEQISDRTLTRLFPVAFEFAKYYGENKGIICALEYCVGPEIAMKLSERIEVKHPLVKEAAQLIKDYQSATEESKLILTGKAVELLKEARRISKELPEVSKEVIALVKPLIDIGQEETK